MTEERHFDPSKIGGPFPLVAALVTLTLVVVPSFVTAAGVVREPIWAAGLFAVAAVLYPSAIIGVIWFLLTKHRDKMMDDDAIIELQRQARKLATRADRQLNLVGATFEALASGQLDRELINEDDTPDAGVLVDVVDELEAHGGLDLVPKEALLESARSLLAQHRWAEAARQLDALVKDDADNWSIQFSRGVAHANSRSGRQGDTEALRAYNEAIALAPADIEANQRARLYIYRAAVKKRLGLLEDALADLALARPLATEPYEIGDLAYNEACVLAMAGKREEALKAVERLIELGGVDLVMAHLDDYFSSLNQDPEFLRLIRSSGDQTKLVRLAGD
jgi:tetratricopeptide (TPR) repeat protein